ncbi:flavodoxin family protein [Natranaerofaba carboxydovora]|uniref:flavodoxin family protein n=1 Tax=Natranaerofaba carboxydovora TaxID=2742683 RepID=UPI001F1448B3|nr:flavodoxin family protein [Natranaerofaba carboxydovora]UMZ73812.1 Putative NAD(P)H-dependent FMN-containing oxidoreductase YwqN [Natranaerofaba carboxydovora]
MKVTAYNGSPRGEKGNTNVLVQELLKGAEKEGASIGNHFLKDYTVNSCQGCFHCWTKTPGKCVINDDMNDLLPEFLDSDIVVLASPLYVDNITAILKLFLERLIPMAEPFFEKDQEGECVHPKRYDKSPKIVVVSNSGFPELSHFQVLELLFKRVARNFGTEVVGEIYRGAGELLKVEHPMLKEQMTKYKELLQNAGKELVNENKILDKTQAELNKPLIPHDEYIKMANKYWNKKVNE